MTDAADHQPHDAFHDTIGHVVSFRMLLGVFAALIFLTFVTVWVTYYDFGPNINLLVAIGIAAVKAILVGLFFMHLFWDSKFNSLILMGSILFVALMISFALFDSFNYRQNVDLEATDARYDPAIVRPG